MKTRQIELEVMRYDPEKDEKPWFQRYEVPCQEDWAILDALNYVKDNIQAFVDIAGQPESGADTGVPIPIGWRLEDPEWRSALGKEDPRFDRASLKLVLVDNRDVFLDRK